MSYNLFGVTTPAIPSNAGTYTLGSIFSSLEPGNILGVRFYKDATNIGAHIGTLWSITGTNLAQVTFSGETASGWQYQAFGAPYPIVVGVQYVVSCYMPNHYSSTNGTPPVIVGTIFGNPLSASGAWTPSAPGNAFPNSAFAAYYFVDGVLDNVVLPTVAKDKIGSPCVVGALQGIV